MDGKVCRMQKMRNRFRWMAGLVPLSIASITISTITFSAPLGMTASQATMQALKIGKPFTNQSLSQDFQAILVAELYHQLGDSKRGVAHYKKIALRNNDSAIAKRVTEIASRSQQLLSGLEMAKRWLVLSPDNLQASQYLALLYLRSNDFKQSAKEIRHIIQIVEKISKKSTGNKQPYSKGLKFVGAMLLIESHHDKALKAFDAYLATADTDIENDFNGQLFLIRASLAEKAKKYQATLDSINSYEKLTNSQLPQSAEVITMKFKALQALKLNDQAITYLTPIIDSSEGSDSLQLELVRLLIIEKQRNRAALYLKQLVNKHPDNNDLLKSLIALQIDQKELIHAEKNILTLQKSKEYNNDAKYFSAELLEARGDLESALENYQKVTGGVLQKSAKKKARSLLLILNKKTHIKVKYMKNENRKP